MGDTTSIARSPRPRRFVPVAAFRLLFIAGPIGGIVMGILVACAGFMPDTDAPYTSDGALMDILGAILAVFWILALTLPYLLLGLAVVAIVHVVMTAASFGLSRLLVRGYPEQRGRLLLALLAPVLAIMLGVMLPGDLAFIRESQQPGVSEGSNIVAAVVVLNLIFLPYIVLCVRTAYRRRPPVIAQQLEPAATPPSHNTLIAPTPTLPETVTESGWHLPR